MKKFLKREWPLIGVVLLPFLYLAYLWGDLPDLVPVHWDIHGEVDRYGSKIELIIIPILLPLLTYALLCVIPYIDPKGKIKEMGSKYQHIKVYLTIFMSVLALLLIHNSFLGELFEPNIMLFLLGVLYMVLGNYFQVIKPNYFIGIRTPWTLEDKVVWKKTHKMGGILWFVSGAVVVLMSLVLDPQVGFPLFAGLTLIIVLIPVVYSFFQFRKRQVD